jgi:hypothetical protein
MMAALAFGAAGLFLLSPFIGLVWSVYKRQGVRK